MCNFVKNLSSRSELCDGKEFKSDFVAIFILISSWNSVSVEF